MSAKKVIHQIFVFSTLAMLAGDLNVLKLFPDSENSFLKLIDITNLFEFISILSLLILMILDRSFRKIPQIYKAAVAMFILFYITCFFSLKPMNSAIEVTKIVYYALMGYAFYHLAQLGYLKIILRIISYSFLMISSISIYDYFASTFDIFQFVKYAYGLNMTSVFGAFVPTSAYFYLYLLILIPLRVSDWDKNFSKIDLFVMDLAIVLGSIVLLGTGRVSIIIPFILSLTLIFIFAFNQRILRLYSKIFVGIALFCGLCLLVAPKIINNVVYRFESRLFERKQGTPEADFIVANYENTWQSFKENPLTGSGLGAFQGVYAKTHVHGTIPKMLGEMGLIGLMGYLIFIVFFVKIISYAFKRVRLNKNKLVYVTTIFLTGSLIAWGYNDHLSQKMFWFFLSLYFFQLSNLDKELLF